MSNFDVGMILTCPKFESDGTTLSPLAGQVVVKNLWPGRYGVAANPGADRIGRGEEWVQTNTLDGQKAHDSFMRIGEPGYFQEFGPAGYHVTIGFANPKIINDRIAGLCGAGADCTHEVKGHVTTGRMSRTPDERLYGSGTHDAFAFTQCYISLGDPDGADFAFTKCDDQGNFDFKGVPAGNWKITTFDQWNDQVVDGITTAVGMCDPGTTNNCAKVLDLGEVAVHQWQANIATRTFFDTDYSGVSTDAKPGLALIATNIRFRDGSYSNFNSTDLNGYATFNEVFPLFNWYVIETDNTRYKVLPRRRRLRQFVHRKRANAQRYHKPLYRQNRSSLGQFVRMAGILRPVLLPGVRKEAVRRRRKRWDPRTRCLCFDAAVR